ncbi:MAG TPA: c-type cytochrome [Puia sp.]|jgi:glucose/arabinose dehydrogenase
MKFSTFACLILLLPSAVLLSRCRGPQPLPPSDKNNGGLILPGGFEALVVTDSIGRARHIAVNDNGDIYVKLTFNDRMKGRGGTVGLRDLNGDGKADSVVYFGDYTDVGGSAVGMSIHDGYLYTSTVTTVLRNKLTAGSLVPESKTEIILTDTSNNVGHNWHTTKPVAFDNKGYMYVPFGAPTDAGQDLSLFGPAGIPNGKGLDPEPSTIDHAAIYRFDASKPGQVLKDGYKYSTGIRSVVGMTWNDEDNTLYAVMNGIDNFHTMYPNTFTAWQAAVLPSEPLLKVTEGSNFGWPYAYFDHMKRKNILQPGYGGDGIKTERADKFDVPLLGFPGHWAPMDILFYKGSQFPERYRHGAFIAFHGSTDRSPYPQAGYIVCFVPFNNGKPEGNYEVFADGFTGVDTVFNTSDAVYRPMGLAEGPDGSLYISESNKGKIWRVMYKGDKTKFGEAQLAELKTRQLTRSYIKAPDSIKDDLHKGSLLEGGILFNSYCATCHQRDGLGDNNRYPPVAGSEWVSGDKTKLIGIVLNGLQGPVVVKGKTYNGLMPAHGGFLDDNAVASIISYIRKNKRFGNAADEVKPKEVAELRKTAKNK